MLEQDKSVTFAALLTFVFACLVFILSVGFNF
ncbi:hypothetical protein BH20ACI4_BH20ACI4_09590 [soil metagenome]